MSLPGRFRFAIIGSGPVGKLLIASVKQHPRIEYVQYEAETLSLRPSFGYGIGPQTFATVRILNPPIWKKILEQSFTSPYWMHFLHATDDNVKLPAVAVTEELGVYGRIGRQELMEMLDDFAPRDHEVKYGMRMKDVNRGENDRVKLSFEDGTEDVVDAVWTCDGMNSMGRKLIQGDAYESAEYSGIICFRAKVETGKVEAAVGEVLASKTHMFIGGSGYFVLIFPIFEAKYVNIVGFTRENEFKKRERAWKTQLSDMLAYFPGANRTLLKLLELIYKEQDCQCLDLMVMKKLGLFYNKELRMTSFGDAANGMPPHMGGSMSTGFIGVTTFLYQELNPRIESLSPQASNAEIAEIVMEASLEYEEKHRPLAQKLCDYSIEQGDIFTGGVIDIDEITRRPKSLWEAATLQR
ncbi:uncharacterized protein LY89DRAFT_585378 [Mollisia scopiformis]|uniref:Uncharacterized protein n=1 Tax=Mollisia scopiformis TaxID=149040 RepID=A0A194X990_MOLSC|nr:uncharacterized protein LY89DRAFT_585378 [Mollisia scopiformis]KUJ16736.1 hypothetical protein LY89DRAFT_585378 [Mollisia scopiformis]